MHLFPTDCRLSAGLGKYKLKWGQNSMKESDWNKFMLKLKIEGLIHFGNESSVIQAKSIAF